VIGVFLPIKDFDFPTIRANKDLSNTFLVTNTCVHYVKIYIFRRLLLAFIACLIGNQEVGIK
jgi:hypothetical protein